MVCSARTPETFSAVISSCFVLFCFVFVFCCILSTAKNRLVPAECFPAESATYYAAGPGILPGLKSIPIVML